MLFKQKCHSPDVAAVITAMWATYWWDVGTDNFCLVCRPIFKNTDVPSSASLSKITVNASKDSST